MTRTLTGRLELPDGTPVPAALVRVIPIGVMPVDLGTGAVELAVPKEYAVANGNWSGSIVAGANYEWHVFRSDGKLALPPFRAPVTPSSSEPITFAEIYLSGNTSPVLPEPVVRVGDDVAAKLGTSETLSTMRLRPDGSGGLQWAPLGTDGEMLRSVYDPDGDGKVESAAAADVAASAGSVPWTGVSDRPDTFPPGAHGHSTGDVSGLDGVLAGKAPVNHTHSIADVSGLQTELNNRATDAELAAEQAAREAADTSEATARATGDTYLQGQIMTTATSIAVHAGASAPHAGHLRKTPSVASDNEIQPSSAGYQLVRLRRHASTADNDVILDLTTADGTTTRFALNAAGRIGVGTAADPGAEWLINVNGGIKMQAGQRVRESGFGSDMAFSPNSAAGLAITPSLRVGASGSAPAGTIEVISQIVSKEIVYLRALNAQTSPFIGCHSNDGNTLFFAVTAAGVVQHTGGVVSLGGNARGANATDLQSLRSSAINVASGSCSAIGGGSSNTASGAWSTIPGGESNLASATTSLAWGRGARALHQYSAAIGDYTETRWGGTLTHGLGRTIFNNGETQGHLLTRGLQTTNATTATLATLAVQPSQILVIKGELVAAELNGGTNIATWDVRVTVKRDGSGNVTLLSVVVDEIDAGPGYGVLWVADAIGQNVKLNVTGLVGHDVLWSLNVRITEVKR